MSKKTLDTPPIPLNNESIPTKDDNSNDDISKHELSSLSNQAEASRVPSSTPALTSQSSTPTLLSALASASGTVNSTAPKVSLSAFQSGRSAKYAGGGLSIFQQGRRIDASLNKPPKHPGRSLSEVPIDSLSMHSASTRVPSQPTDNTVSLSTSTSLQTFPASPQESPALPLVSVASAPVTGHTLDEDVTPPSSLSRRHMRNPSSSTSQPTGSRPPSLHSSSTSVHSTEGADNVKTTAPLHGFLSASTAASAVAIEGASALRASRPTSHAAMSGSDTTADATFPSLPPTIGATTSVSTALTEEDSAGTPTMHGNTQVTTRTLTTREETMAGLSKSDTVVSLRASSAASGAAHSAPMGAAGTASAAVMAGAVAESNSAVGAAAVGGGAGGSDVGTDRGRSRVAEGGEGSGGGSGVVVSADDAMDVTVAVTAATTTATATVTDSAVAADLPSTTPTPTPSTLAGAPADTSSSRPSLSVARSLNAPARAALPPSRLLSAAPRMKRPANIVGTSAPVPATVISAAGTASAVISGAGALGSGLSAPIQPRTLQAPDAAAWTDGKSGRTKPRESRESKDGRDGGERDTRDAQAGVASAADTAAGRADAAEQPAQRRTHFTALLACHGDRTPGALPSHEGKHQHKAEKRAMVMRRQVFLSAEHFPGVRAGDWLLISTAPPAYFLTREGEGVVLEAEAEQERQGGAEADGEGAEGRHSAMQLSAAPSSTTSSQPPSSHGALAPSALARASSSVYTGSTSFPPLSACFSSPRRALHAADSVSAASARIPPPPGAYQPPGMSVLVRVEAESFTADAMGTCAAPVLSLNALLWPERWRDGTVQSAPASTASSSSPLSSTSVERVPDDTLPPRRHHRSRPASPSLLRAPLSSSTTAAAPPPWLPSLCLPAQSVCVCTADTLAAVQEHPHSALELPCVPSARALMAPLGQFRGIMPGNQPFPHDIPDLEETADSEHKDASRASLTASAPAADARPLTDTMGTPNASSCALINYLQGEAARGMPLWARACGLSPNNVYFVRGLGIVPQFSLQKPVVYVTRLSQDDLRYFQLEYVELTIQKQHIGRADLMRFATSLRNVLLREKQSISFGNLDLEVASLRARPSARLQCVGDGGDDSSSDEEEEVEVEREGANGDGQGPQPVHMHRWSTLPSAQVQLTMAEAERAIRRASRRFCRDGPAAVPHHVQNRRGVSAKPPEPMPGEGSGGNGHGHGRGGRSGSARRLRLYQYTPDSALTTTANTNTVSTTGINTGAPTLSSSSNGSSGYKRSARAEAAAALPSSSTSTTGKSVMLRRAAAAPGSDGCDGGRGSSDGESSSDRDSDDESDGAFDYAAYDYALPKASLAARNTHAPSTSPVALLSSATLAATLRHLPRFLRAAAIKSLAATDAGTGLLTTLPSTAAALLPLPVVPVDAHAEAGTMARIGLGVGAMPDAAEGLSGGAVADARLLGAESAVGVPAPAPGSEPRPTTTHSLAPTTTLTAGSSPVSHLHPLPGSHDAHTSHTLLPTTTVAATSMPSSAPPYPAQTLPPASLPLPAAPLPTAFGYLLPPDVYGLDLSVPATAPLSTSSHAQPPHLAAPIPAATSTTAPSHIHLASASPSAPSPAPAASPAAISVLGTATDTGAKEDTAASTGTGPHVLSTDAVEAVAAPCHSALHASDTYSRIAAHLPPPQCCVAPLNALSVFRRITTTGRAGLAGGEAATEDVEAEEDLYADTQSCECAYCGVRISSISPSALTQSPHGGAHITHPMASNTLSVGECAVAHATSATTTGATAGVAVLPSPRKLAVTYSAATATAGNNTNATAAAGTPDGDVTNTTAFSGNAPGNALLATGMGAGVGAGAGLGAATTATSITAGSATDPHTSAYATSSTSPPQSHSHASGPDHASSGAGSGGAAGSSAGMGASVGVDAGNASLPSRGIESRLSHATHGHIVPSLGSLSIASSVPRGGGPIHGASHAAATHTGAVTVSAHGSAAVPSHTSLHATPVFASVGSAHPQPGLPRPQPSPTVDMFSPTAAGALGAPPLSGPTAVPLSTEVANVANVANMANAAGASTGLLGVAGMVLSPAPSVATTALTPHHSSPPLMHSGMVTAASNPASAPASVFAGAGAPPSSATPSGVLTTTTLALSTTSLGHTASRSYAVSPAYGYTASSALAVSPAYGYVASSHYTASSGYVASVMTTSLQTIPSSAFQASTHTHPHTQAGAHLPLHAASHDALASLHVLYATFAAAHAPRTPANSLATLFPAPNTVPPLTFPPLFSHVPAPAPVPAQAQALHAALPSSLACVHAERSTVAVSGAAPATVGTAADAGGGAGVVTVCMASGEGQPYTAMPAVSSISPHTTITATNTATTPAGAVGASASTHAVSSFLPSPFTFPAAPSPHHPPRHLSLPRSPSAAQAHAHAPCALAASTLTAPTPAHNLPSAVGSTTPLGIPRAPSPPHPVPAPAPGSPVPAARTQTPGTPSTLPTAPAALARPSPAPPLSALSQIQAHPHGQPQTQVQTPTQTPLQAHARVQALGRTTPLLPAPAPAPDTTALPQQATATSNSNPASSSMTSVLGALATPLTSNTSTSSTSTPPSAPDTASASSGAQTDSVGHTSTKTTLSAPISSDGAHTTSPFSSSSSSGLSAPSAPALALAPLAHPDLLLTSTVGSHTSSTSSSSSASAVHTSAHVTSASSALAAPPSPAVPQPTSAASPTPGTAAPLSYNPLPLASATSEATTVAPAPAVSTHTSAAAHITTVTTSTSTLTSAPAHLPACATPALSSTTSSTTAPTASPAAPHPAPAQPSPPTHVARPSACSLPCPSPSHPSQASLSRPSSSSSSTRVAHAPPSPSLLSTPPPIPSARASASPAPLPSLPAISVSVDGAPALPGSVSTPISWMPSSSPCPFVPTPQHADSAPSLFPSAHSNTNALVYSSDTTVPATAPTPAPLDAMPPSETATFSSGSTHTMGMAAVAHTYSHAHSGHAHPHTHVHRVARYAATATSTTTTTATAAMPASTVSAGAGSVAAPPFSTASPAPEFPHPHTYSHAHVAVAPAVAQSPTTTAFSADAHAAHAHPPVAPHLAHTTVTQHVHSVTHTLHTVHTHYTHTLPCPVVAPRAAPANGLLAAELDFFASVLPTHPRLQRPAPDADIGVLLRDLLARSDACCAALTVNEDRQGKGAARRRGVGSRVRKSEEEEKLAAEEEGESEALVDVSGSMAPRYLAVEVGMGVGMAGIGRGVPSGQVKVKPVVTREAGMVSAGIIGPWTKFTFRSHATAMYMLVQAAREMYDPADAREGGGLLLDRLVEAMKAVLLRWVGAKTAHRLTLLVFSRTYIEPTVVAPNPSTHVQASTHVSTFSTSTAASSASAASVSASSPPPLELWSRHGQSLPQLFGSTTPEHCYVEADAVMNVDARGRVYQDHYIPVFVGVVHSAAQVQEIANTLRVVLFWMGKRRKWGNIDPRVYDVPMPFTSAPASAPAHAPQRPFSARSAAAAAAPSAHNANTAAGTGGRAGDASGDASVAAETVPPSSSTLPDVRPDSGGTVDGCGGVEPVAVLAASADQPAVSFCARAADVAEGPILEAFSLMLSLCEQHYLDRSLVHSGQQLLLLTPGSGAWETDLQLNRLTAVRASDNGVGIDVICCGPPLQRATPFMNHAELAPVEVVVVPAEDARVASVPAEERAIVSTPVTSTLSDSIRVPTTLSTPRTGELRDATATAGALPPLSRGGPHTAAAEKLPQVVVRTSPTTTGCLPLFSPRAHLLSTLTRHHGHLPHAAGVCPQEDQRYYRYCPLRHSYVPTEPTHLAASPRGRAGVSPSPLTWVALPGFTHSIPHWIITRFHQPARPRPSPLSFLDSAASQRRMAGLLAGQRPPAPLYAYLVEHTMSGVRKGVAQAAGVSEVMEVGAGVGKRVHSGVYAGKGGSVTSRCRTPVMLTYPHHATTRIDIHRDHSHTVDPLTADCTHHDCDSARSTPTPASPPSMPVFPLLPLGSSAQPGNFLRKMLRLSMESTDSLPSAHLLQPLDAPVYVDLTAFPAFPRYTQHRSIPAPSAAPLALGAHPFFPFFALDASSLPCVSPIVDDASLTSPLSPLGARSPALAPSKPPRTLLSSIPPLGEPVTATTASALGGAGATDNRATQKEISASMQSHVPSSRALTSSAATAPLTSAAAPTDVPGGRGASAGKIVDADASAGTGSRKASLQLHISSAATASLPTIPLLRPPFSPLTPAHTPADALPPSSPYLLHTPASPSTPPRVAPHPLAGTKDGQLTFQLLDSHPHTAAHPNIVSPTAAAQGSTRSYAEDSAAALGEWDVDGPDTPRMNGVFSRILFIHDARSTALPTQRMALSVSRHGAATTTLALRAPKCGTHAVFSLSQAPQLPGADDEYMVVPAAMVLPDVAQTPDLTSDDHTAAERTTSGDDGAQRQLRLSTAGSPHLHPSFRASYSPRPRTSLPPVLAGNAYKALVIIPVSPALPLSRSFVLYRSGLSTVSHHARWSNLYLPPMLNPRDIPRVHSKRAILHPQTMRGDAPEDYIQWISERDTHSRARGSSKRQRQAPSSVPAPPRAIVGETPVLSLASTSSVHRRGDAASLSHLRVSSFHTSRGNTVLHSHGSSAHATPTGNPVFAASNGAASLAVTQSHDEAARTPTASIASHIVPLVAAADAPESVLYSPVPTSARTTTAVASGRHECLRRMTSRPHAAVQRYRSTALRPSWGALVSPALLPLSTSVFPSSSALLHTDFFVLQKYDREITGDDSTVSAIVNNIIFQRQAQQMQLVQPEPFLLPEGCLFERGEGLQRLLREVLKWRASVEHREGVWATHTHTPAPHHRVSVSGASMASGGGSNVCETTVSSQTHPSPPSTSGADAATTATSTPVASAGSSASVATPPVAEASKFGTTSSLLSHATHAHAGKQHLGALTRFSFDGFGDVADPYQLLTVNPRQLLVWAVVGMRQVQFIAWNPNRKLLTVVRFEEAVKGAVSARQHAENNPKHRHYLHHFLQTSSSHKPEHMQVSSVAQALLQVPPPWKEAVGSDTPQLLHTCAHAAHTPVGTHALPFSHGAAATTVGGNGSGRVSSGSCSDNAGSGSDSAGSSNLDRASSLFPTSPLLTPSSTSPAVQTASPAPSPSPYTPNTPTLAALSTHTPHTHTHAPQLSFPTIAPTELARLPYVYLMHCPFTGRALPMYRQVAQSFEHFNWSYYDSVLVEQEFTFDAEVRYRRIRYAFMPLSASQVTTKQRLMRQYPIPAPLASLPLPESLLYDPLQTSILPPIAETRTKTAAALVATVPSHAHATRAVLDAVAMLVAVHTCPRELQLLLRALLLLLSGVLEEVSCLYEQVGYASGEARVVISTNDTINAMVESQREAVAGSEATSTVSERTRGDRSNSNALTSTTTKVVEHPSYQTVTQLAHARLCALLHVLVDARAEAVRLLQWASEHAQEFVDTAAGDGGEYGEDHASTSTTAISTNAPMTTACTAASRGSPAHRHRSSSDLGVPPTEAVLALASNSSRIMALRRSRAPSTGAGNTDANDTVLTSHSDTDNLSDRVSTNSTRGHGSASEACDVSTDLGHALHRLQDVTAAAYACSCPSLCEHLQSTAPNSAAGAASASASAAIASTLALLHVRTAMQGFYRSYDGQDMSSLTTKAVSIQALLDLVEASCDDKADGHKNIAVDANNRSQRDFYSPVDVNSLNDAHYRAGGPTEDATSIAPFTAANTRAHTHVADGAISPTPQRSTPATPVLSPKLNSPLPPPPAPTRAATVASRKLQIICATPEMADCGTRRVLGPTHRIPLHSALDSTSALGANSPLQLCIAPSDSHKEWLLARHDFTSHPHGCTHIELRWLNSSGPSVTAFVRAMQREVNSRALLILPLPVRQSSPELAHPLYNCLVLRLPTSAVVKAVVEWLVVEKAFVLDRPPVVTPQRLALAHMPTATHICSGMLSSPPSASAVSSGTAGHGAVSAGSVTAVPCPQCTLTQALADAVAQTCDALAPAPRTRASPLPLNAAEERSVPADPLSSPNPSNGAAGSATPHSALSSTASCLRSASAASALAAHTHSNAGSSARTHISTALRAFAHAISALKTSAQHACSPWEVQYVVRAPPAQDGLPYLTLVQSNALAMVRVYEDRLVWVPITLPSAQAQLQQCVGLFRSLVAKCEAECDAL